MYSTHDYNTHEPVGQHQTRDVSSLASTPLAATLTAPSAPLYDRMYVYTHPELVADQNRHFHYDRAPFPGEWQAICLPAVPFESM